MVDATCCDELRDRFRPHASQALSVGFDAGLSRWVLQCGLDAVAIDFCPWCGISLHFVPARPRSLAPP